MACEIIKYITLHYRGLDKVESASQFLVNKHARGYRKNNEFDSMARKYQRTFQEIEEQTGSISLAEVLSVMGNDGFRAIIDMPEDDILILARTISQSSLTK